MKIVNKIYNISNKLNKKIVLISDIHYYSKKDIYNLNKVFDNIKKINPNYICISGDVIDNLDICNLDLLIDWLKKLTDICYVIVVLGNHEFYSKNKYDLLDNIYIKSIKGIKNLFFLDNINKVIDNINFIGLTLPKEHYIKENKEDFKKYIKNIRCKKKYYNILLCHSPINIINYNILKQIDVELVLCGHMHGGIIPRFLRWMFKTRGLINPHKKLFPKYTYGRINRGNKNIIITSGIKVLSKSHFLLFNNVFSSEVVVINI